MAPPPTVGLIKFKSPVDGGVVLSTRMLSGKAQIQEKLRIAKLQTKVLNDEEKEAIQRRRYENTGRIQGLLKSQHVTDVAQTRRWSIGAPCDAESTNRGVSDELQTIFAKRRAQADETIFDENGDLQGNSPKAHELPKTNSKNLHPSTAACNSELQTRLARQYRRLTTGSLKHNGDSWEHNCCRSEIETPSTYYSDSSVASVFDDAGEPCEPESSMCTPREICKTQSSISNSSKTAAEHTPTCFDGPSFTPPREFCRRLNNIPGIIETVVEDNSACFEGPIFTPREFSRRLSNISSKTFSVDTPKTSVQTTPQSEVDWARVTRQLGDDREPDNSTPQKLDEFQDHLAITAPSIAVVPIRLFENEHEAQHSHSDSLADKLPNILMQAGNDRQEEIGEREVRSTSKREHLGNIPSPVRYRDKPELSLSTRRTSDTSSAEETTPADTPRTKSYPISPRRISLTSSVEQLASPQTESLDSSQHHCPTNYTDRWCSIAACFIRE